MSTPAFRRFVTLVLGIGLLAWLASCWWLPVRWPLPGRLVALALTAAVAELRSLYVAGYGMINFGEGLYLGATLAWGGPIAAPVTALVGFVADRVKGRPPVIVTFNLGWSLCTYTAVALATRSFQAERGMTLENALTLVAGSLAYAGVAASLQSACQTFERGLSLGAAWKRNVQGMVLGAPTALVLGLFAQVLLQLATWTVALALLPIEIFTAYVRVDGLHKQLLATQAELQSRSREAALGALTAGVAHELNNPLAGMATGLHLLERQDLDPLGRQCLTMVTTGLERCRSITDRMLLYGQPPETRPSTCRLADVIGDACLFLAGRLASVRVEIAEEVAVAPLVGCDPGVLLQVITNLLSNSADALLAGVDGKVRFEASRNPLRLLMCDNGAGIPPDITARIWEPFYTTRPVGAGTGLGLSVSLSLMRSVGGDLRLLYSSPRGTTFELDLPTAGASESG